MQNIKIHIPYGNGSLALALPKDRILGILQNKIQAPKNIKKLLLKAMRNKKIPFRKKKVLIVVPDATRSAHLKEILPLLIEKITVPSRSVDIMVANGLHKHHTAQQLQKLLGLYIARRHRIFQHDPYSKAVVDFGKTKYDVPATLDKAVLNYDSIISVGVVEPHLYAGYSGGAKTISIGLAGEPTVNATHSIRFLDDPGVNIGSLNGNKFQETLWHILENIPPVFSVNIVNDQDGKALKIFCGPVKDVFEKSSCFAKEVFEVRVNKKADIAVCGIGYPKDVNLYQASRAMNYVLSVDKPVVKKGGIVIIAAELKDGVGHSPAENRFYDELKHMESPAGFVSRVKREGCIAGEHRAYMVAKALIDYNVIFVTSLKKDFMEDLPFRFYSSVEEALEKAFDMAGGNPKIFVIPRSLATIPRQV